MAAIGFDSEKYARLQSQEIRDRLRKFGGKLYMEIGGKIFDDYHAARILPGFQPDSKIRMLATMKDELEAVICVNCNDIEKSRVRGDIGITYDLESLRMIDLYRSYGIKADNVVLTLYTGQPAADKFAELLRQQGIAVSFHRPIAGYPTNTELIVSDDGYGKNDYVETSMPIVLVTGPGPGSGKMAVCLSQIYQDGRKGVRSGYAKFETFPVWSLPLNHPVNLAYEAATADLGDVNMIDPFHMEAYGKSAINYNRDIEAFPVLKTILDGVMGESPYKSPTDMGINTVGFCISDDKVVSEAARREIVRRYYRSAVEHLEGKVGADVVARVELLMKKADTAPESFLLYREVRRQAKETGVAIAGIELPDGSVVTGKATKDLTAVSATLLNALKVFAAVDGSFNPIPPEALQQVEKLKRDILRTDPKLRADEMLVALAISANESQESARAFARLNRLRGCDLHGSVVISPQDNSVLRKLGINVTNEPVHQDRLLYRSG